MRPEKGSSGNGRDVLTGDGAQSVLKGGRGDDTYIIMTAGVRVDEKNNGGTDTVIASVDHVLDANVENLTLDGEDDLAGAGNQLDNLILGNVGNNTLTGGGGSDTIDGGAGEDTVIFDGAAIDHILEYDGTDLWVTDLNGESSLLLGIEHLVFDDIDIALAPEVAPSPTDAATESAPEPAPAPAETLPESLPPEDETVVPDAPVAADDAAAIDEDQSVTLMVMANDTGERLTIIDASNGHFGTVTINPDNTLTYVPAPDAHGTDSFSYTVSDAYGRVAAATATVDIQPLNDAPEAMSDGFTVPGDAVFASPHSVLLNDADPDGDKLVVVAFDEASEHGGTVNVAPDGTFTYTPPTGYAGSDRFSYAVSDAMGASDLAWVDLVVEKPPQDEPTEPAPEPDPLPATEPLPASDPQAPPSYIDTLLAGDWYRLNANEAYGSGATVTFAFAGVTPDYYALDSLYRNDFRTFDETQQDSVRSVLDMIETYCGLTFVESAVEDAEMVFGFADIGSSGFAFWPTYDGVGKQASDVWLDTGLAASPLVPGSESYKTLIHEIGHALGLTHPVLPVEEETRAFTVMADPLHPTMDGAEPSTYMPYDIAALQYLYGQNAEYSAGNDVYAFDALDGTIQTIWDSGGHDTLDLSAAAYGVDIDLADGSHSTVAASGTDNLALAFGSDIEDVVGSSHDDRLVGNELDNMLTGGSGNDVFGFRENWGHDQVTDFVKGQDLLDFSGTGLSIESFEITFLDDGMLISHGENSVFLSDGVESLAEEDFLFA